MTYRKPGPLERLVAVSGRRRRSAQGDNRTDGEILARHLDSVKATQEDLDNRLATVERSAAKLQERHDAILERLKTVG